jgi:hypothetical protein
MKIDSLEKLTWSNCVVLGYFWWKISLNCVLICVLCSYSVLWILVSIISISSPCDIESLPNILCSYPSRKWDYQMPKSSFYWNNIYTTNPQRHSFLFSRWCTHCLLSSHWWDVLWFLIIKTSFYFISPIHSTFLNTLYLRVYLFCPWSCLLNLFACLSRSHNLKRVTVVILLISTSI